jgi:hypothetical protein
MPAFEHRHARRAGDPVTAGGRIAPHPGTAPEPRKVASIAFSVVPSARSRDSVNLRHVVIAGTIPTYLRRLGLGLPLAVLKQGNLRPTGVRLAWPSPSHEHVCEPHYQALWP